MALKKRQSALEASAIEERNKELVRNREYSKGELEYKDTHKNALSNPDKPLGKGVSNSDHQAYIPILDIEQKKHQKNNYNRSSLNTSEGGGLYDIKGRNGDGGRERLVKINLYSKENPYGNDIIDMEQNLNDGQYVIKM